jgi:catechol 2,3-dioxygenase-like lactoylglutathione lyase family enzyme
MAKFWFDHIHIFCADVDQTVRFYVDNFGAQFHGVHDYGEGKLAAHLDLSGVEILISNADPDHRAGLHHIGFRTSDLEEAAAELRTGGCQVPGDLIEVNPRFKLVHIAAMPECVDIELQNGSIHDIPLAG